MSCTSIYIHRHVVATHGSLGAQLGLGRRRYGGRQRGGGPRHSGRSAGADADSETRRGGELERASSAVRVAVAQPLPAPSLPCRRWCWARGQQWASSCRAPAEPREQSSGCAGRAGRGRMAALRTACPQAFPRTFRIPTCLDRISHACHRHHLHIPGHLRRPGAQGRAGARAPRQACRRRCAVCAAAVGHSQDVSMQGILSSLLSLALLTANRFASPLLCASSMCSFACFPCALQLRARPAECRGGPDLRPGRAAGGAHAAHRLCVSD